MWGFTFADAHVKVYDTILKGNSITNCSVDPVAAAEQITSLGYNMSSDASCPFTQATDLNSTDAMLGPLADNGGPTDTQAPGAFSPAIDRVSVADCSVAADQRGVARPQGGACDVGAAESSAVEQLQSLQDLVAGTGPGASRGGKNASAVAAPARPATTRPRNTLPPLLNEKRAQTGE